MRAARPGGAALRSVYSVRYPRLAVAEDEKKKGQASRRAARPAAGKPAAKPAGKPAAKPKATTRAAAGKPKASAKPRAGKGNGEAHFRPGGRSKLPREQSAARLAEIVHMRMMYPSWSWSQIAETVSARATGWKITDEGCRIAYSRWLDDRMAEFSKLRVSTAPFVAEQLEGFRVLRELASKVAMEASEGKYRRLNKATGKHEEVLLTPNHSSVLGAVARVAELRVMEITLLQELGLVPKQLGMVKMEIDAKRMVEVFFNIITVYVTPAKRAAATGQLLEDLRPAVSEGVLADRG